MSLDIDFVFDILLGIDLESFGHMSVVQYVLCIEQRHENCVHDVNYIDTPG